MGGHAVPHEPAADPLDRREHGVERVERVGPGDDDDARPGGDGRPRRAWPSAAASASAIDEARERRPEPVELLPEDGLEPGRAPAGVRLAGATAPTGCGSNGRTVTHPPAAPARSSTSRTTVSATTSGVTFARATTSPASTTWPSKSV